ncbi:MAG: hypothetical protein MJZ17_04890 [Bacteroidales bacterium]|nr:hypothetical protein [Bacteroidales bacterium]
MNYFIELNEGVFVNAAYVVRMRRLDAEDLKYLSVADMKRLGSALRGTGICAESFYMHSDAGGYNEAYKARDSMSIANDLPELYTVLLHGGVYMYALAKTCKQITGVKQL